MCFVSWSRVGRDTNIGGSVIGIDIPIVRIANIGWSQTSINIHKPHTSAYHLLTMAHMCSVPGVETLIDFLCQSPRFGSEFRRHGAVALRCAWWSWGLVLKLLGRLTQELSKPAEFILIYIYIYMYMLYYDTYIYYIEGYLMFINDIYIYLWNLLWHFGPCKKKVRVRLY